MSDKYPNQTKYLHTDKGRKSRKLYARRVRIALRNKLLDALGGICVCDDNDCEHHKNKQCGISDKRILNFEHKNNDGYKRRKSKLSPTEAFCRFYLKDIQLTKTILQIMCPNCNIMKRYKHRINALTHDNNCKDH